MHMLNQFMRKKTFKYDIGNYSCSRKNSLKLQLESVHEEKNVIVVTCSQNVT